jgi:hypothetical protein
LPGKDGEADDIGFIVDAAGCSQAENKPLEARSSFQTEPYQYTVFPVPIRPKFWPVLSKETHSCKCCLNAVSSDDIMGARPKNAGQTKLDLRAAERKYHESDFKT